jgi:hypothetical protein
VGPTATLVLGGLLVGVFLLLVAVLLWQEARTRGQPPEPVWGIEDATDFVLPRLEEAERSRVGRDGVRRVVEWQVNFLQQLAKADAEVPIVVGATEGTISHIAERVARQGHPLADADIAAILDLVGDYLVTIGVVGPVAEEPPDLS